MILLDTHIWIWWAGHTERLTEPVALLLSANEQEGLGLSVISCWEVAKLVEVGRFDLMDKPFKSRTNNACSRREPKYDF
jgi:PIN domain nuclease of toxin-antitoxin system